MNFEKFASLSRFDDELHAVRTAVEGSPAVKAERDKLLPNPSTVTYGAGTEKAKQQSKRYEKYIQNAEFEDYTNQTEQMMVGKLDLSKVSIEVPNQIDYLKVDSDGDKLSLAVGMLGDAVKNVLEAKWHIVLADYSGLPDLDIGKLSIDDVKNIKKVARVKFKQYSRESLIKYNTSTINGIHQVDFMMFKEHGYVFNKESGARESVTSYLVLGLDDDGNYYQEKHTEKAGEETSSTNRNYIKVGSESLKYIPFYVFSDEELGCGDFPQELGFLSKIANLCLHRYRQNADFKDYMSGLPPTDYVSVKDLDMEVFEKINGRRVIAKGEANIFATDSLSVTTSSSANGLESWFRYFEDTKETLKSYGAFMPDDGNEETATKARINAAQQNSVLIPIVDNLVEGVEMLMFYAGVFEGVWKQDDFESAKDKISVAINSEFDNTSLTGQEMLQLVNSQALAVSSNLTTQKMAIGKLYESGVYPSDMSLEEAEAELNASIEG